MGHIAAGIIFFAVHYQYWGATRISSKAFSLTMVCLSLLLGSLALAAKYESRVAFRCALLGYASLAFVWYFNGAYLH